MRHNPKNAALASAGLLAILWCGGCTRGPYQIVPVTGTVTCNGKPAVGGMVMFVPVDDPATTNRPPGQPGVASRGRVREDGTFVLETDAKGVDPSRPGALIGRHEVSFFLPQSKPWTMSREDEGLPAEQQKAIREKLATLPVYPELECGKTITPFEVVVTSGGQNQFEFTLGPK